MSALSIGDRTRKISERTEWSVTAQGRSVSADIAAIGFWGGRSERAFFDVRVFNPLAPSNRQPLPTCYRKHENKSLRTKGLWSWAWFLHSAGHVPYGWARKCCLSMLQALCLTDLSSVTFPTAAPWPGLDVACHSPFFALLSNASGVPAQPLVMQSNSQFLHWILSPPKQGFPPLANFELHMRFQTATHFIYFWIFRCCPPPTPLYIHYRLYWYFVLVKKKT